MGVWGRGLEGLVCTNYTTQDALTAHSPHVARPPYPATPPPALSCRTMDRLAVLNVVGVGAIGMLALTALGLAVKGLSQGTAYPIPLWPQWQLLGHTRAEQLQALMAVVPVMIACYVAHQVSWCEGWV